MKNPSIRSAGLLLASCALAACGADPGPPPPAAPPAQGAAATTVWQLSPFALLVRGNYDGVMPMGEVQRHGDLGLGAADQLDGEMLLVDGTFYQFLENGRAVQPAASMRMPFAAVTHWQGGRDVPLGPGLVYDSSFMAAVDASLPTTDAFYALRMEGTFDVLVARTYKRQTRPYPQLGQAPADTFTITGATGVMVGFREPSYADSLSVPNYHLHFIDDDRTRGGHVLQFTTRNVRLQVSERPEFTLRMPAAPPMP